MIAESVSKSRFGFHPCDMDIYLKLKAIKKAYFNGLHLKSNWGRWYRKDPKNRVSRTKIRDASGRVIGYGEPTPRPEPELCALLNKQERTLAYRKSPFVQVDFIEDVRSAVDDFYNAQKPQKSESEVVPLKLSSEQIEKLFVLL